MEVLKVSGKSDPKSVAGAIAAILRTDQPVELNAIGAAAVNQVVKSVAIARGYVSPNGIEAICIPAFSSLVIDGKERTSIKFIVEKR